MKAEEILKIIKSHKAHNIFFFYNDNHDNQFNTK